MRLGARLGAAAFVCAIFALVTAQFTRVIQENVALARSLHDVRSDIVALEAKKERQERDIRRLSDPRGALPEIHDLLRLVGPNQAIIYLKGQAPDGQ